MIIVRDSLLRRLQLSRLRAPPGAVRPGVCVPKSASMKKNCRSADAAQFRDVLEPALFSLAVRNQTELQTRPAVLNHLKMLKLEESGIGPTPGRTFPETFQLPPVTPAF